MKSNSKKKIIIQKHHISYNPEWIVKVRRAEHFYITRLNNFKTLSRGFLRALLVFVIKHWKEAKELE